ncbi:MAG: hypothetical protein ABFS34_03405 [Gemmatimonadota bacterium]
MFDDPFVVVILVLIAWQFLSGLFGKKKGPTGQRLPPGERKPTPVRRTQRPTPPRQTPAERPGQAAPAGGKTPWWEATDPVAAGPTAEERPWWEAEEESPRAADADPGRDEREASPAAPAPAQPQTPQELWQILTGQRLPVPVPRRSPPPSPARQGTRMRIPEPTRPREGFGREREEPAGDELVLSLEGESLETIEMDAEARHAEFHRKIAKKPPKKVTVQALTRLGLGDVGDVRRAIVLSEILGPPASEQGW